MAQEVRRTYRAKQIIFREAESADHAFLIRAGTVAILKHTATGPVVLATIGKNAIFGEMALIDGSLRMASAVAAEENTICTLISKEQLREHLGRLSPRSRIFFDRVITYVRDNLPWPDRSKDPKLAAENDQDRSTRQLLAASEKEVAAELKDAIMIALHKILVDYVRRRLPPVVEAPPPPDDPIAALFKKP